MKRDYLIAIDLDGTLITGFDNYDKESFFYLKELSKTNKIIIATGRPFRSSKYYYDMLGLKTPIINYNGALVHNPHDINFPKSMITIPKEVLFDFIKKNENVLDNIFCEIEDDIYLWRDTDFIKPYLHLDGGILHVGEISKILPFDSNGAISFSKRGSEKQLEDFINSYYSEILKIRFWGNENYVVSEIYNPTATKGVALKKIADYYHINKDKIITIGDGHNDIDMFKIAKYGVAMENSHPELIKYAKIKTKSVLEHGVYSYLKDFFEKK